jgi:putative FmdB family regulatory protein
MPGREYVCAECGHHFRTPEGMPRDNRSLMCPACGSNDLNISTVERPAPIVMRAKAPILTGDEWRAGNTKAS